MSTSPFRRRGRWAARLVAGLLLAAALTGGALPAAAQATGEPEPFYLNRLQDGERAYTAGDAATAARELRLACFGLLEYPPRLAGCLTRLALAQSDLDDGEAFAATFRRLVEVEERFGAYTAAELPRELTEALEERLARWIPEAQLQQVPAFSGAAAQRIEIKVSRLPVAERRTRLEELVGEQPDEPRWRLALAELELAAGEAEAAAGHSAEALRLDPASQRGRCLDGRARAALGACETAVERLAGCPLARQELDYAEALLGCQVAEERWADAAALLDALPAALAAERPITRLARRLPERPAATPATSGAQTEATPPPPATAPTPTAAPLAAEPTAADLEKMAHARQLMAAAREASDLEEPMELAAEVAADYPDYAPAQHLAAQVAYRAGRWQEAADYFARGGDPGDDQPVLLFYMAITLYETGQRQAAAAALQRALPQLKRNAFVDEYRQKILAGESSP